MVATLIRFSIGAAIGFVGVAMFTNEPFWPAVGFIFGGIGLDRALR